MAELGKPSRQLQGALVRRIAAFSATLTAPEVAQVIYAARRLNVAVAKQSALRDPGCLPPCAATAGPQASGSHAAFTAAPGLDYEAKQRGSWLISTASAQKCTWHIQQ